MNRLSDMPEAELEELVRDCRLGGGHPLATALWHRWSLDLIPALVWQISCKGSSEPGRFRAGQGLRRARSAAVCCGRSSSGTFWAGAAFVYEH